MERPGLRSSLLAAALFLVPACGGGGGSGAVPFVLLLPVNAATGVSISPTFTWTGAVGATSYLLQVSTDPAFGTVDIHRPGLAGLSDSPPAFLAPGTQHFWRVYAVTGMGTILAGGSPALFTTLPLPGAFNAQGPLSGAVDVPLLPLFSWTASAGATSYALQVATDAGFAALVIDETGIVSTSFVPTSSLATSSVYHWRVSAENGSGSTSGTGSPRSFTTLPPPPGAFSLTAPANSGTDVSITPTYTWTASSAAASYTLQVSTSPVFATFVVNQAGLVGTSHAPTAALSTSTTYHWQVTAINSAGSLAATGSPASFTTGPPAVITLSSTTLSFSATAGGANPAAQDVQITNPSGLSTPLRWSVSSDRPWLQVGTWSGTTLAETDLLSVSPVISQTEAWTTDVTLAGVVPSPRENHSMVWTGTEMIVWGGTTGFGGAITGDGKRYDPATDSWAAMSSTNAPSPRWGHSAVWTGSEMIVWGGRNGTYYADGYRYNPRTDTWSGPIATNPGFVGRRSHASVWTGVEMLVWGGENGNSPLLSGARYDSLLNSWQAISTGGFAPQHWHLAAVWTGTEMIVRGGWNGSGHVDTGARYLRGSDTWTAAIDTVGTPPGLSGTSAVWTGTEMIVWGGLPSGSPATNQGGRYDPGLDDWVGATTTTNAPAARRSHAAVWAGAEMIVWGGYDGGAFQNTGRRYRPPVSLPAGVYTGTLTLTDPEASNSPRIINVTLTVNP